MGRIHCIGQTREVFIFNLCTADSLESRILALLLEKIPMFELVMGEIGAILGNLEGGEEFESLVLNRWLKSRPRQVESAKEIEAGKMEIESQKRAVDLELLRKLNDLDQRYATEATLRLLELIRTEMSVMRVRLEVIRK